ncbi:MAG: hypothetical protein QOE82_259 [Thermoanaerobaculia bacterium]|nr:hypothetical protein [Thermoanaerobaculia bacterium]
MKILHLILSLRGGGAERQLAYLAPELAWRGHDVHVAFVYDGVNSEPLQTTCGLHPLRSSAKYHLALPIRLAALVRKLRPDLLQTWLTHMDVLGGTIAKFTGVPWLITERSSALMYPPTLLNRVRETIGRRADRIVSNSRGGADYWLGHGVENSRLEVIPNFVPAAELESAEAIDDPRIDEGDEIVLHVGRLSPEKNVGMVIEAMEAVCRVRPRARLVVCGDGPLLADLQRRAANLGDRVIFAGFVPNVSSWLKRAAVVVAVSLFEGHPNAVLESAVAGVPVVVSDIPAYRSVLAGDAAEFVPCGDAAAIAAAIVRTLEDRPAASERVTRARATVAALSPENLASRYEAAYASAIAHARGAAS